MESIRYSNTKEPSDAPGFGTTVLSHAMRLRTEVDSVSVWFAVFKIGKAKISPESID